MNDSAHWGHTGEIELSALAAAKQLVTPPTNLTAHAGKYVASLHQALLDLTEQWRDNANDEHGYGVCTIHIVRRALEK